MAVIRVGVQAPAGGAGQLVDLDGPRVTVASITNASGESIQYSLDGGATWATLASAATATSGVTVQADQVRMRKVSGGSYPAPVDVDATIIGLQDNSSSGGLTTAQAAAVQKTVVLVSTGNATADAATAQAALLGGNVTVAFTGAYGTVISVDSTALVDDNTTIFIADGVTVKRTGTGSTQVFSNRNKTSGNVNIRILGQGTIDGNNTVVTGVAANIRAWNVINMVNVDGLTVSGMLGKTLTVRDGYKFLVFAGNVRNYKFEDLTFLSSGAASPGRDGIHLQGNSRKGVIQRIYGSVNDDLIAVNTAAVALNPNEVYPQCCGPIRELAIRDIYGSVQDRSGNVVALYSSSFSDEAATVIDGNPDALTATSVRPTISSISVSGTIATVTTSRPHLMSRGDVFKITGSNPTGYNAYPGFVLDIPSSTTFTYQVPSPGAYVSGGVLTIYWHLDDITVENVRGNTAQSNILSLVGWAGAPGAGGVIRGLRVNGVSGDRTIDGVNGSLISWGSILMIDSVIENFSTPNAVSGNPFPLLNVYTGSGQDVPGTWGSVVIRNPSNKTPNYPYQTSGSGVIVMVAGSYRNLTIEGFAYSSPAASVSWRHGITMGMLTDSTVTLRNCTTRSLVGSVTNIAAITAMDSTCTLRLENCSGLAATVESLADFKGTVTGGTVVVSGGVVPSGASSAVTCYGNGVTVIFDGGFENRSSNPPARFLGTSANCNVKATETTINAATAIANLGGTGPYSISGLGSKIDVANAKCNRQDGVIVYNTNAAAGTLASAGLVVGQGTAANSWKLLSNTSLSY